MKWIADLHTHSAASDGQYRPTELVSIAKERGIQVLALTDHDTIAGTEEAVRAGERLGVQVVRGVEFSARGYHTFHILGYRFSPDAPEITAMFAGLENGRDDRKYRIADYLKLKGVDIPLSEVEELAQGVVGRPHFARVMLKRGVCSEWKEVFDLYLDTDEFHRIVEKDKPEARTCMEAVKNAGGVVSLAHPYQIGLADDELDALVGKMKDWGLDAIECRYPKHTPAMTAQYLNLADRKSVV